MTWAVAAVAGATLVSGYMQGEAAKSAAQTQADAANAARRQLTEAGYAASAKFEPYANLGQTALSDIAANRGYFQNQFTNKDLNANLAPGYDFRLGQGQRADLMASNVGGGAISGNALRSLQDYTQNFASNEYGNAFNQYQAQRTNIFNQLSSIAKIGLTGAAGQANSLLGTGTQIADITSGLGNAQAASQMAQGKIYGNTAMGLGNAGAYYAMNNMNQPLNTGSSYSSYGVAPNQAGGQGFTTTAGNSFTINPA